MASWDNVQTIGPPSLVPPKADFSALSEIVPAYYQGQQAQRQQAIQNVFKGGFPTDAAGQPDYKAAAQRLFQLGDFTNAQNLMKFQLGVEGVNALGNTPSGPYGTPGTQTSSMQPQPVQQPGQARPAVAPIDETAGGNLKGPNTTTVSGPPQPMPDQGGPPIPRSSTTVTTGQQAQLSPEQQPQPRSGAPIVSPNINSAQWQAAQQAGPGQIAAAAAMLEPQDRANPLGFVQKSFAAADYIDNAISKAKLGGVDLGEAARERAKNLRATGQKVLDALAPTTETKNLLSGTTRAAEIQKTDLANAAEEWKGISGEARQYERVAKGYIQTAKSVLNQPQTYTGFGGDTMQDFNKFRAIYGDAQGALYGDALAKLNSMNVLATIGTMKSEGTEAGQQASRIFSGMVDEARKTGVNINTSIAGNRFLAEFQSRLGEYAVRKRDLAQKYRAEHGGALDDNFTQVLNKDMKDHPLFTKAEEQNPSLIGVPTSPYTDPGQTAAWGQQMGLKDDAAIRTPNGRIIHLIIHPKPQPARAM